MVFPSIRSFQEISLIPLSNFGQEKKETPSSYINISNLSKSDIKGRKIFAKRTLRKSVGRLKKDFQYPIAS